MILKENWICHIVNFLVKIFTVLNIKRQQLLNESKINNIINKDLFIVLNGPSIQKQDLNLLKGKTILFVNRGFYHPLYKFLSPKYHMFIDPKMLTGQWPLKWIDLILNMVPNITFIMPVSWAFKDQLKPYIQNNISIIWFDDSTPATLLGVGGYSLKFALNNNFEKIFFTGFEATGLAHEMINSVSHFYGTNNENLAKTTKEYILDLYMFSKHLNDLTKLSLEAKRKNIEIINLTDGGLLDMFPRMNLNDV